MNYNKFYDAVAAEYGPEVALATIQILTINMTTKIKLKDLKTAGRFTEKIKRKVKDLLWEYDPQIIQQAFACWEVSYAWQTRQSLQGMGGCEAKTIKELVDEVEVPKELVCTS